MNCVGYLMAVNEGEYYPWYHVSLLLSSRSLPCLFIIIIIIIIQKQTWRHNSCMLAARHIFFSPFTEKHRCIGNRAHSTFGRMREPSMSEFEG
ncbi:hypothetical protein HD806DRAFT_365584 [Xylariaceae sp. AK1471]|nr:hypothetical protein HD806DRAFT_365584 [Xylariaceae sp. AK1471]